MMHTTWLRTRRKREHESSWASQGLFHLTLLISCALAHSNKSGLARCPSSDSISSCPCFDLEDGLLLECVGTTEESIKAALLSVLHVAGRKESVLVQSLNIYELDRKVEELQETIFPNGAKIRHLQISQSGIREFSDNTFSRLGSSLESLAIVSGKLQSIPQKALSPLLNLSSLELEANSIRDLPSFSFVGLSLAKINFKENKIGKISEYAFAGLEEFLRELNLAENRIRLFPMTALRRLMKLSSLYLASNEISKLPEDGYSRLEVLVLLDLSSNNFDVVPLNCFRCCPALKTLSLSYNAIEKVDKDAFISLIHLEVIDVSHNKIVFLESATFRANQKLRSVDMSHNHLHYLHGVFAKLPDLKELYLAENNILEIDAEAFTGSVSLNVIHLQHNAIRRIDSRGLSSLEQLTQLHLTGNYIENVPHDFLESCKSLSILSLDGNYIRELEVGTFAKAKQLRELRLQDNQIGEVKRKVFAPLPSLVELHLQNNAIADMETGALRSLHSLQHVNLQGNLLSVLGDVFQVSEAGTGPSLITIQLDNNGLDVVHNDSLRGQASVRIMWLGHNRLTSLQAPLFRDLLLVERLYLTNNSISRIDDTTFQPMQALKFLDLSMNKLNHVTEKTFSELGELEELYLANNGLRRLEPYSLTALKHLRILDLSNNHLGTLHDAMFQESLPIRTLNLRNCSIGMIDRSAFRGLKNLYELNLESNHLTASALERLQVPGLRVLRISENNFSQVSEDSLDGFPSLQHLAMSATRILTLPNKFLSKNKHLMKVLLSDNLLEELPDGLFNSKESLREVQLDGNRFQELPYDIFSNVTSLEFLSFARNLLTHIDASRLRGLRNLRELDLSANRLISLAGFAMANLSRLLSVNLSHNHLAALPPNFFTRSSLLRKLELAGNKFRQIPAVALSARNLPNLSWLNVSSNPLSKIYDSVPGIKYPALQEVHISKTNLTVVTNQDLEAFLSLVHLFMPENSISRLSPGAFRSLGSLATLDLGGNKLEFLPQERLKGLEHLSLLNLTRNRLKELDEFSIDLKSLRLLDLSYNQIGSIGETTFHHLETLSELNLFGNWISFVAPDAFRLLKKLTILDLSRNHLRNLPLNAFRPLETQIRSLHTAENPLHCGCETQELWEWLRDHQKLVGGNPGRSRGMGISEVRTGLLKCEQPQELRGLVFLDLDPSAFCSAPLVLDLVVQDMQAVSVILSWQSRNHSGIHGYQVAYHPVDNSDETELQLVNPSTTSLKLTNLSPNTHYLICVIGLGNWFTRKTHQPIILPENAISEAPPSSLKMADSPTSKCTETTTLPIAQVIAKISSPSKIDSAGPRDEAPTMLTRRLGLIVGCCLGFVVFVAMTSILGYLKIKKQREVAERDQQAIPPEYVSYRHFSIQSGGEAGHAKSTLQENDKQPSFIGDDDNAGPSV